MSKPLDTSKQPAEAHLVNAMVQGASNSIEASEAAGQREVLESTAIPSKGYADAELEKMGFKLEPIDESDPLFRECKLPEGWAREGTAHSMHSYIIDEKGRRRLNIFYKAAFYDRRADARIVRHTITKAQEEAAEAWENSIHDGDFLNWTTRWAWNGETEQYEVVMGERELGEDGRAIYDAEAHDYKHTGRIEAAAFALDGTQIAAGPLKLSD